MTDFSFSPFPQLITDRLILRQLAMADAPEVFFLRSDKQVLEHLCKEPAKTIKEAEDFIERIDNNILNNESILWGIVLKNDTSKVIGTICLWNIRKEHYRAEIGYVLHPSYWRQGLMKEAIRSVLEYGFDSMHMHSIDANIGHDNAGSEATLRSAGFVKEAHFKEDFFYQGKFFDTIVYSILRQ